MDLSSEGNSSVFHVYVRNMKRIACKSRQNIHAVIVEESMHKFADRLCQDCQTVLEESAGEQAGPEQEELAVACVGGG